MQEILVTDPITGGQKGAKLARFSLIPPEFLWALAEHYGKGARKYEDRNWERGYQWSLSLDALERHLNQWLRGEDRDEETDTHHLICVAWHAIALFVYSVRGLGTDNVRVKSSNGAGSSSNAGSSEASNTQTGMSNQVGAGS